MQKPLGIHRIRSQLVSLPLSKLHPLYKFEFKWKQAYSNRIGYFPSQTFKSVGIKKDDIANHSFLKMSFANQGIDAINFRSILHRISVKSL